MGNEVEKAKKVQLRKALEALGFKFRTVIKANRKMGFSVDWFQVRGQNYEALVYPLNHLF